MFDDGLRVALYVGIAAAVVMVVCLIILGMANSGSRNISLALGTLFGAMLLMGIQFLFELQSTENRAVLAMEFTTDNEKPKIEQFKYAVHASRRQIDETEANKFLLKSNPEAYQGDGEKLWKDMSLY